MLELFKKRRRPEKRNYTNQILNALASAAGNKAASVGASAAVEAAGGLLARSLLVADVSAPEWARAAITPSWLALVGRELVRCGEHLSLMTLNDAGQLELVPASHWDWRGGVAESDWTCHATAHGPDANITRHADRSEVVWIAWGTLSLERHRGQGPLSLAHLAAKAAAESERSLGDEAGGPVGQLLTTPEGEEVADDGDDTTPADPYADLRRDIAKARGAALLLETTSGGHGERGNAPARDWVASRLGPNPPAALVQAAADGYERMLSACGCPPSLFMGNAQGTAQREGLRRWHQSTVLPVAKLLTHELSARLEAPVSFNFDSYAMDMQARATTVAKLVAAGVDLGTATAAVGLPED